MADLRHTKESKLGAALGFAKRVQEEGFTSVVKDAMQGARGNGLSMQTNAELRRLDQDLKGVTPAVDSAHSIESRDDHSSAKRPGASIKLPNGDYVTAIEYQKLQEALLRRR